MSSGFRAQKTKKSWENYRRDRLAMLGLGLFVLIVGVALAAPLISPYDPTMPTGEAFTPPNDKHLFGTDHLGMDVLSRTIYGARYALLVGVLAGIMGMLVGIIIGSSAGYYRGRVDDTLMRFTETFMSVPRFLVALIVALYFGSSLWNVIIVIGILYWPMIARLTRAEFLSLRERDFVVACRALGAKDKYIIFKEILPNALPPIIVGTTILMGDAIGIEAGLSFLGVSDPNIPTLGRSLQRAAQFLHSGWWIGVFPGIMLSFIVIAFNLIGEGLNDALNPRLSAERRSMRKGGRGSQWLKRF